MEEVAQVIQSASHCPSIAQGIDISPIQSLFQLHLKTKYLSYSKCFFQVDTNGKFHSKYYTTVDGKSGNRIPFEVHPPLLIPHYDCINGFFGALQIHMNSTATSL